MRHPWANIALLLLLIFQAVTGYFGFSNGLIERRWLLWLHGIGAYAILLVLLWKGAIIWDVFSRGVSMTWRRLGFLLMLGLLLLTLGLGLGWTFFGPRYFGGFSWVSLHIYVAIPLLLLMAWHTWHKWFIVRHPEALGSRRTFLQQAGVALTAAILWPISDLLKPTRRFTGSYETGSFSGIFPRVSWINDNPPPIEPETWQLQIDGEAARQLALSYEQLLEMADSQFDAILDCTGGWYSEQTWRGVSIESLLELASPTDKAHSVSFHSVTGYERRFSLDEIRGYLLALEVGGAPLSHGHGFPARLVAPGKRGFHWVKWLTRISLNRGSHLLQLPLPLE
jgi:hypothetical protein